MFCSSVWQNIGKFAVLHLLALYGLTLLPSLQAASWAWLLATYVFSGDLNEPFTVSRRIASAFIILTKIIKAACQLYDLSRQIGPLNK